MKNYYQLLTSEELTKIIQRDPRDMLSFVERWSAEEELKRRTSGTAKWSEFFHYGAKVLADYIPI